MTNLLQSFSISGAEVGCAKSPLLFAPKRIELSPWMHDRFKRFVAGRGSCPLFDTVIVKWKGRLADYRMVICPLRVDYGGLGGHGYTMLTGEELINPNWCQSANTASLVGQDLAAFLCRDAMPLIRDGRLVAVPAPLVGCTQSAIGWTDDLFVNGLLGGAVSVAGTGDAALHGERGRRRILDLSTTVVPYIEDVAMSDLARALKTQLTGYGRFELLFLRLSDPRICAMSAGSE